MALTKIDDRGLKTPIDLLDDEKIRFGTSDDLEIFHGGGHSKIYNANGNIYISNESGNSSNIVLQATWGEESIIAKHNGAVELYHDGSKKFETRSDGTQTTGICYADRFHVNDSELISLGDGSDLQFTHDGSNSFIRNTNGNLIIEDDSGQIFLQSTVVSIESEDGETQATFTADGSVDLYHNNSKKLETTSAGIEVTGRTFMGDASDSSGAGNALWIGAGNDLKIFHNGSHSFIDHTGTGHLIINGSTSNNVDIMKSGHSEYMARFIPDGAVELYYNNVKCIETQADGFDLFGAATYVNIGLRTSDGTSRGYVYADDSSNTGFLSDSGSWKFRIENDGDYQFYGSNVSDRDKKDNITTVTGTSLDKITKLVPKTYKWKNLDGKTPTNKTFTGFIAQEVKEHLPSLVTGTDGQKNMSVDYNGILAHAVKAITELSAEVETLKTKVAALEAA